MSVCTGLPNGSEGPTCQLSGQYITSCILKGKFRLSIWHWFKRFFYYEPIFKTRCEQVGKGLILLVGIPQVLGHLSIRLGENVTLHGSSTFQGAKVFKKPTLKVGDNSHIGYMVTISVGCDVSIGNNVLIGNRVIIMNYDGHPVNPEERHLPAPPETSRPITIYDNVWIGDNCLILKGVTIGKGSVIAAGSVVTKDVPQNCLAMGNPSLCRPMILEVPKA